MFHSRAKYAGYPAQAEATTTTKPCESGGTGKTCRKSLWQITRLLMFTKPWLSTRNTSATASSATTQAVSQPLWKSLKAFERQATALAPKSLEMSSRRRGIISAPFQMLMKHGTSISHGLRGRLEKGLKKRPKERLGERPRQRPKPQDWFLRRSSFWACSNYDLHWVRCSSEPRFPHLTDIWMPWTFFDWVL